jgi:hypothetical protein
MRQRLSGLRRSTAVIAALVAISPFAPFLSGTGSATPSVGSLYSYSFAGVTTTPLPNGAETNTGVPLKLFGTWAPSTLGIHFVGDKVSKRSVAFAKPTSGPTLAAAASDAVGAAVKFRFEAPVPGACYGDTHNVTQIGRFASGATQLKMQLSSCAGSKTDVFAECRMVGANSTTADLPKRGSQALINSATYVVKCFKGPDPDTGQATLTLMTTKIDAVNGNVTTVNTFLITRPGAMVSSEYLSVANKYPMPGQKRNTDQFSGDVASVAYCKAPTTDALNVCLDTEVPAS